LARDDVEQLKNVPWTPLVGNYFNEGQLAPCRFCHGRLGIRVRFGIIPSWSSPDIPGSTVLVERFSLKLNLPCLMPEFSIQTNTFPSSSLVLVPFGKRARHRPRRKQNVENIKWEPTSPPFETNSSALRSIPSTIKKTSAQAFQHETLPPCGLLGHTRPGRPNPVREQNPTLEALPANPSLYQIGSPQRERGLGP
jgi:hypothetical protein